MKYAVISKLAPGIDNARKALEVFGKVGLSPETESAWAALDGKTFVIFVDQQQDVPDMMASLSFAPFFEESTVIPVVPLDDTWLKTIQAAQANWG
jgi:hypothetical protein